MCSCSLYPPGNWRGLTEMAVLIIGGRDCPAGTGAKGQIPNRSQDDAADPKDRARFGRGALPMTRRCELTGKLPLSGNIRSHAENATRRKFRPNLVNVTLISEVLDRQVKLRISRLCVEVGRAPRRPRCLPGESSRRGALGAVPEAQARDRQGQGPARRGGLIAATHFTFFPPAMLPPLMHVRGDGQVLPFLSAHGRGDGGAMRFSDRNRENDGAQKRTRTSTPRGAST